MLDVGPWSNYSLQYESVALIGGPATLAYRDGAFRVRGRSFLDLDGDGHYSDADQPTDEIDFIYKLLAGDTYTVSTSATEDGLFELALPPLGTREVQLSDYNHLYDGQKWTVSQWQSFDATINGSATLDVGVRYQQNVEIGVTWDVFGDGTNYGHWDDDLEIPRGRVYADLNGDGVRQSAEPSAAIAVTYSGGPSAAFIDVMPGTYTFRLDGAPGAQSNGVDVIVRGNGGYYDNFAYIELTSPAQRHWSSLQRSIGYRRRVVRLERRRRQARLCRPQSQRPVQSRGALRLHRRQRDLHDSERARRQAQRADRSAARRDRDIRSGT
ncbi:MAG: hypothetical protein QM770_19035 [Tepidisphaeraceae bacterium]